MRAILSCISFAPSVGNAQPWRFVRLRSAGIRAALSAHVDTISARSAERYAGQARYEQYVSLKLHGLTEAPELLAVFCDECAEAGHGLGIATMPEMLRYSCVLAIHNVWLAARLRGIGVVWVSILDPLTVQSLLDVPEEWSLIALLCVGYPAEDSTCPTSNGADGSLESRGATGFSSDDLMEDLKTMLKQVEDCPAIVACNTCRHSSAERENDFGMRHGAKMIAVLRSVQESGARYAGISVQEMPRLFACTDFCTVHLRAPGKVGNVLGRLAPDEESATAIFDHAIHYAASERGRVPFKEWPQGVRGHFITRTPPQGYVVE